MAQAEARAQGAEEALLLNTAGEVVGPTVAVMSVVPTATPCASPVLEIVAFAVSELTHVALEVTSVVVTPSS